MPRGRLRGLGSTWPEVPADRRGVVHCHPAASGSSGVDCPSEVTVALPQLSRANCLPLSPGDKGSVYVAAAPSSQDGVCVGHCIESADALVQSLSSHPPKAPPCPRLQDALRGIFSADFRSVPSADRRSPRREAPGETVSLPEGWARSAAWSCLFPFQRSLGTQSRPRLPVCGANAFLRMKFERLKGPEWKVRLL